MKRMIISMLALAVSSVAVANDTETVTVQSVDFKGKPPFKRTMDELPVSDVAQFEQDQEMVAVKVVQMGSKPPYKRRTVYLPVTDVAQFETTDDASKTNFRGKPPFKR